MHVGVADRCRLANAVPQAFDSLPDAGSELECGVRRDHCLCCRENPVPKRQISGAFREVLLGCDLVAMEPGTPQAPSVDGRC